jgi:two-component system, cell cycle response regulator DivK
MKRIALVEDNPDNRLLVHAILGGAWELDEYESGVAALSGMLERLPDLVLLDVSLPGMDGVEVLRAMREEPRLRKLPVIALTAHAMIGDRQRFLEDGFDGYVAKPIVDERVLLDTIHLLLGS